MTGSAAQRPMRWLPARVAGIRDETATTRTIAFDTPGWPGHLAGQHVDVRLTAEDGYRAERSYSIASPPDGQQVELTVQRIPDGEVSPYLVGEMMVGDEVELRGPVGGWFVWRPEEPTPVLLVAGGSGVVPLMAMVRERARSRSGVPFSLLYSVRSPDDVFYADELSRCSRDGGGLAVTLLYTRSAPRGTARPVGRIGPNDLTTSGCPPESGARAYVCGPTAFVEAVAGLLVDQGYDTSNVRTERFGPTGG
jgi:ferredoxin-NADP reductase